MSAPKGRKKFLDLKFDENSQEKRIIHGKRKTRSDLTLELPRPKKSR